MKCTYDLHIHTCLSPCGDDDMTPNNIANMAALSGLDVIAVTDHNTAGNARAVVEAGEKAGVCVVPGIELETSEEVHVLLLFGDVAAAEVCGAYVASRRLPVKNRVDVYGHQTLMDANDNAVGFEPNLLVVATDIGIYETAALARQFGGVAVPAHIDKPANGLLQMLGTLSDDMGFTAVELSPHAPAEREAELTARGYTVIRDSDAHYLETLAESGGQAVDLCERSAKALVDRLRRPRLK